MSEITRQSLQQELSALHNLEDCLLVSLKPTGRSREVDILLDYPWVRGTEARVVRPDIGYRSNLVRIRLQGLQDLELRGDLTDAMRHEPERINWGLSQISFSRCYNADGALGLTLFGLPDRQVDCRFDSYQLHMLGANHDARPSASVAHTTSTSSTNMRNLSVRESIIESVADIIEELRHQMETGSAPTSSWQSAVAALQHLLDRSGVLSDPIACLGDTLRSLEEADALQRLHVTLSAGESPENGRYDGGGSGPDAQDLLHTLSLSQRALAQPNIPGDATSDIQAAQSKLDSHKSNLESSTIVDFQMFRYGYGLELRFDANSGDTQQEYDKDRRSRYPYAVRMMGVQKLRAEYSAKPDISHARLDVNSIHVSKPHDMLTLTFHCQGGGRFYAEFDAIDFVGPGHV